MLLVFLCRERRAMVVAVGTCGDSISIAESGTIAERSSPSDSQSGVTIVSPVMTLFAKSSVGTNSNSPICCGVP